MFPQIFSSILWHKNQRNFIFLICFCSKMKQILRLRLSNSLLTLLIFPVCVSANNFIHFCSNTIWLFVMHENGSFVFDLLSKQCWASFRKLFLKAMWQDTGNQQWTKEKWSFYLKMWTWFDVHRWLSSTAWETNLQESNIIRQNFVSYKVMKTCNSFRRTLKL